MYDVYDTSDGGQMALRRVDPFGQDALFLVSYVAGRLVATGKAQHDDVRTALLGEAHVFNLTPTWVARTVDDGLYEAERESAEGVA